MFVRLLFVAALLAAVSSAAAAPVAYTFDKSHTQIIYFINHMGMSNSFGKFNDFDGTFMFDTENPANSSVKVSIKVDSLYTSVPKLDEHLKGDDFFAVAKFPAIEFASTQVENVSENALKVTGDLTIHGVTHPATLAVTINKMGMHPVLKKPAAGFSATTTIKRSDFGIKNYLPALSDEVQIRVETEAMQAS